jgi:DHA1 family bicyclomycin/chloramphenicol resistance-like MFS transporter
LCHSIRSRSPSAARSSGGPETTDTAAADGIQLRLPLTRLTILLGSLSAFGPFSTDMYMPGLPGLRHSFGATTSAAQLTFSACVLGMGIGQAVVGPLSDARGRRSPLLLALTCYTATSALCAIAPQLWLLIGLRLVQGATGGASVVIARAVAGDLVTGAAAVRLYARLMLVFGIAPILAPIAGGQIVGALGWRAVFVVLSGIGATLLVIVWRSFSETLPPARRRQRGLASTAGAVRALLGNRRFMRAALASALGSAALVAYIGSMSFAFKSVYGFSAQRISLVFALSACGMILGSLLAGQLVQRASPLMLLRAGLWLGAGAGSGLLVVVVLHHELILVLLLLFCALAATGFCAPTALALAVASDPQNAGSAAGLIGIAGAALGSLSAPLAGLLGGGTMLAAMAAVMAAFMFLAAAATMLRPAPTAIPGAGRWPVNH